MRLRLARLVVFATLAAISCGAALAGPLDPPPGPVGPTMKTLGEVEPRIPIDSLPFQITASGSYYLTNSFEQVPSDFDAIRISAGSVTLDLNGFAIRSDQGGPVFSVAIVADPGVSDIAIRNGTISGFLHGGIVVPGAKRCRIENLVISRCGGWGGPGDAIRAGDAAMIRWCTVEDVGYGIRVGNNGHVESCSVSNVSWTGIIGGDNCVVINSVVARTGLDAGQNPSVILGRSSLLSGCSIAGPGPSYPFVSIHLGDECRVADCTIRDAGIVGGAGTVISGSFVSGVHVYRGVRVGPGSRVSESTVRSSVDHALWLGAGSTASRCSIVVVGATKGDPAAVYAADGCVVEHCSVASNSDAGIEAGSRCVIVGNRVSLTSADSMGILVSGSGTAVKDNHIQAAPTGISVTGTGNIIARNSVWGSAAPFSIAPGNMFATSTDPATAGSWANIAFE